MHRVMVVDDDKLIREDIIAMVNWRQLGFCEPMQCGDGLSAIKELATSPCDLVITDISMPGLNGVELIREAQALPQTPLVVVLSNYDDFGYVKEAMRLGAVEYLLKYQLEPDTLTKMLRNTSCKLDDSNRMRRQQQRLTDLHSRQRAEMVDYFWKDLYFERVGETVLQGRADALGIHSGGGTWVPLMITLQREAARQAADRLHRMITELPSRLPFKGKMYLTRVEHDKLLATACFPENSFLILNKYLSDLTQLLEEQLNLLSLPSFIRCGKLCVQFAKLPQALQEIRDSASLIFYLGYRRTVASPALRLLGSDSFSTAMLDDILSSVGLITEKELRTAVQHFFTALREHPVAPEIVKRQLYTALCNAADSEAWMSDGSAAADGLQTLEEYQQVITQLVIVLHGRRGLLPRSARIEIKNAADYIYQHYADDLPLHRLAEVSGLSRNYFSRIFKEEAGVTYTDFLNMVRLEHAKRMLERDNLRTNEVASSVGFDDYRYFCRVFKSVVGTTCTEYRKRVGREGI